MFLSSLISHSFRVETRFRHEQEKSTRGFRWKLVKNVHSSSGRTRELKLTVFPSKTLLDSALRVLRKKRSRKSRRDFVVVTNWTRLYSRDLKMKGVSPDFKQTNAPLRTERRVLLPRFPEWHPSTRFSLSFSLPNLCLSPTFSLSSSLDGGERMLPGGEVEWKTRCARLLLGGSIETGRRDLFPTLRAPSLLSSLSFSLFLSLSLFLLPHPLAAVPFRGDPSSDSSATLFYFTAFSASRVASDDAR